MMPSTPLDTRRKACAYEKVKVTVSLMIWPATTGTGAGLPANPSDASLKSGPPPATLQLAMGVAVVQTANPVATRPITPFESAVIVPVSDRLVRPE